MYSNISVWKDTEPQQAELTGPNHKGGPGEPGVQHRSCEGWDQCATPYLPAVDTCYALKLNKNFRASFTKPMSPLDNYWNVWRAGCPTDSVITPDSNLKQSCFCVKDQRKWSTMEERGVEGRKVSIVEAVKLRNLHPNKRQDAFNY